MFLQDENKVAIDVEDQTAQADLDTQEEVKTDSQNCYFGSGLILPIDAMQDIEKVISKVPTSDAVASRKVAITGPNQDDGPAIMHIQDNNESSILQDYDSKTYSEHHRQNAL